MRRGMTLIEVIVAMGLLAGIAGMTWVSLAGTLDARDLLEQADGVQQGARVTMSRVERELELAWLTSHREAINTYRTVFVAEDSPPIDRIWFSTLSHQRLYRDARECDQTEITLWGEDDPENRSSSVLMHREAPRVDHEPDKDGVILPLAYGVERFDLSFLDGRTGEWEEEWDSTGAQQGNRLPRAVRMVLVLLGPDPDEEEEQKEYVFSTTVMLEYADAMTQSVFSSDGASSAAQSLGGF